MNIAAGVAREDETFDEGFVWSIAHQIGMWFRPAGTDQGRCFDEFPQSLAYVDVVSVAALTLLSFSSLSASQYFGLGFWKYLGANLLFLNFLAPGLPGVFTSHLNYAEDGALWTLKIEVVFYLCVPIIYYLCHRFGTKIIMGVGCSVYSSGACFFSPR